MKKHFLLIIISMSFLMSCNNSGKVEQSTDVNEQEIPLKYATHFKIFKSGNDFRIEIYDRQKVVQEFKVSTNPQSDDVLKIPFKRYIATSTTHLGYVEQLDLREGLIGFPNTNFISDTILHHRVIKNELVELGTAESMNMEKLFELNPDVIFDFPNPIAEGQKEKLKKAGLKTILITEFYEETALGKVEWIKLFGLLLGKQEKSNIEFQEIERRYIELTNSIEEKENKPTVFSGIMFGDTWYAPGGQSFAAKFYKDVGANYVWKDDSSSGSNSFSFERVFKDAVGADYWIGVGGQKSLESLLSTNSNYSLFKAFKQKNVYSFYGGITTWGANSYFEKGVLEPDVILKDLIIIFDEKGDKSKLVYHKRLY